MIVKIHFFGINYDHLGLDKFFYRKFSAFPGNYSFNAAIFSQLVKQMCFGCCVQLYLYRAPLFVKQNGIINISCTRSIFITRTFEIKRFLVAEFPQ